MSPNAKEWLAEESYSPQYGARPLLRLIQRELLNPLSKLILKGHVVDDQEVSVTVNDQGNGLLIVPGALRNIPK